jgi:hypothetical protein
MWACEAVWNCDEGIYKYNCSDIANYIMPLENNKIV